MLKFNLGNLDIKETDRVIITVICLQNVKNVFKNDVVIQKKVDKFCFCTMTGIADAKFEGNQPTLYIL